MPTTTANSVAPSIMAAVMIIAVEICPAAAGCRAIDSTADPPIRPIPAAPPMIARPAPRAPPNHPAPLLVMRVLSASWASAVAGNNTIPAPTTRNPRASLVNFIRSIHPPFRCRLHGEQPFVRLVIAVTPYGPHQPRTREHDEKSS